MSAKIVLRDFINKNNILFMNVCKNDLYCSGKRSVYPHHTITDVLKLFLIQYLSTDYEKHYLGE